MAANKKRRRLPEEDLTAAVEEMIRSPITRANLNFLNMGPEPTPMGAEPDPAGPAVPKPMGVALSPGGFGTSAPAPEIDVRTLWRAEQIGTLFDVSRVRRIQQAQDALSLAEEKVYDLLWGQKNLKKDEFRLVHCSLQRIAREARLNIKTVRELIPRLVDKGFIDIEAEADARRNLPTLYRVWSYGGVLARQRQQNRLYVLKTGKGVFYAHPVQASIEPEPHGYSSTPMGVRPAGAEPQPAGLPNIAPLGVSPAKPTGAGGTLSIGISEGSPEGQTTTDSSGSICRSLAALFREELGLEPDDLLLSAMVADCSARALESTGQAATEEEILHFAKAKARVLSRASNIRNHAAVMRKALPECFSGDAFRAFRAAASKQFSFDFDNTGLEAAERRHSLWTDISARHRTGNFFDMQAIAEDPDLDDQGRAQARELWKRFGRLQEFGL